MTFMICLRYLASNDYQIGVGDDFGVSQSTVSRCFSLFVDRLSLKLNDFVIFPTEDDEVRRIQQGFYQMNGFPQVVGLIDGSHVRILAPSEREGDYVNRKRYHSINVQAVCDHEQKFMNIVSKWPRSCHDSFILRQSDLWDEYEAGNLKGFVLGDSGYCSRSWFLLPLLNPTTNPEKSYNGVHKKTRVLIEQTSGVWKRRFGMLHQELRLQPANANKVIASAAILHNIAIDRKQDIIGGVEEDAYDQPDVEQYNGPTNSGVAYRQHLIDPFFS